MGSGGFLDRLSGWRRWRVAVDTKLERLHAIPLFAGCDHKELSHLGTIIDSVEIKAGYALMEEGHRSHYAYVVESGTADVQIDGESVAEISDGEMIGEISLLAGGESSATVVAKTPMSLMVIPHQQFEQILRDAPGLGIAIARELAQRLRATDNRLH